MRTTAVGILGAQLDRGESAERWEKWRPTVSLFQHEDLLIHRFEMLYESRFESLARRVVEDIQSVSPETDVHLNPIDFGRDPWDFEAVYAALFDWAQSYAFDPEANDHLIHITTGTHVAQICLFLLNEAGYMPGSLIQTGPPRARRNQRQSPPTFSIIDLDLSKYDRLTSRFERSREEASEFLKSGIATRDAQFNAMIERIEQVALRSHAPILLMGPTGAGKSQLAKRIYQLRRQRGALKGELVTVNCATLRGDTANATLFGHVKGAFTGAHRDRAGLLREADRGLLFLDEIGELGLDEQAVLLQAIEEKRFLPVGADRPVESDFQLIAGTNRDLRAVVGKGVFRADLLARLQFWTFDLPALRERPSDIAPNLDYEIDRFAETEGRRVRWTQEAKSRFLRFALDPATPWCGNFRDLNAAVARMATLANHGRIRDTDVDMEIERLHNAWKGIEPDHEDRGSDAVAKGLVGDAGWQAIDPFDRPQLAYVVEVCRRSRTLSDAGRALYAVSRQKKERPNDADRLKKYLAKFGLSFSDISPIS